MHTKKLFESKYYVISFVACIITLLFSATLPFIPIFSGMGAAQDSAYYNIYYNEAGKRIATPEGDAVLLYGPFLNSARTFSFGTPLIEEHSSEFLNVSLVLSMLPFSLMVWLFGLTWGSILGIILCHFFLLLLLLFIFRKLTKKISTSATQSLILSTIFAITTFLAFIVFRPFNITTFLRTRDISSFLGVFGDLGYFTRLPSYSFTFVCLVASLLVIYYWYTRTDARDLSANSAKNILFILFIGFCGIIYLYNFIVIFAVLCIVIVLLLLLANNKKDLLISIKKRFVLLLSLFVLSVSFFVTFIAKYSAQPDNLLGFATKYGLVSTHGFAKENAGALLALVVSIVLIALWVYVSSAKSKSNKSPITSFFLSKSSLLSFTKTPAGFVFVCLLATVLAANANVVTGFSVQVFHLVDFLAFFGALLFLLLLLSFNRHKVLIASCCAIFILIVILSNVFLVRDEFRPLDSQVKGVLDYLQSNDIKHQTILSSDETITYLLPVYTNNYLFTDNSYFAHLNVTQNLERFAKQSKLLNAPLPANQSIFSYSLYENMFFHWAYTYLYTNPPCESCTFNGEKKSVGWLDSSFAQVPDHLASFYYDVLVGAYNEPLLINDFASVDYVLVSKKLDQNLSFSQSFALIYENEDYALYQRNN